MRSARSTSPASRSVALNAARTAELVSQLDTHLVVPLLVGDESTANSELDRFLKEMGVADVQPIAKLQVSISTVPDEPTVILLESRGKA